MNMKLLVVVTPPSIYQHPVLFFLSMESMVPTLSIIIFIFIVIILVLGLSEVYRHLVFPVSLPGLTF